MLERVGIVVFWVSINVDLIRWLVIVDIFRWLDVKICYVKNMFWMEGLVLYVVIKVKLGCVFLWEVYWLNECMGI